MKASGLIVSLALVIIPAATLLLSGLTEQGIINASVAAIGSQVLNLVLKILQERPTDEPPAGVSRSVAVERELTPMWKRVLLG